MGVGAEATMTEGAGLYNRKDKMVLSSPLSLMCSETRSEGVEPCSSRRKMCWVDLEIKPGMGGPDGLEGSESSGRKMQ